MFLLIFLIFLYLSLSIKTIVIMGIVQVHYIETSITGRFEISNDVRVFIIIMTVLFGILAFRDLALLIKMSKEGKR
jgi:hypothetical protein